MNLHNRAKVAAVIAVMFLVNFYYFKSWRKTPQSSEAQSSGSNNQFKLIKLILSPSSKNNRSCGAVLSQWSEVYYVNDVTTGVTSVFIQNSRSSHQDTRTSRQDIKISIVHLDHHGFVNSVPSLDDFYFGKLDSLETQYINRHDQNMSADYSKENETQNTFTDNKKLVKNEIDMIEKSQLLLKVSRDIVENNITDTNTEMYNTEIESNRKINLNPVQIHSNNSEDLSQENSKENLRSEKILGKYTSVMENATNIERLNNSSTEMGNKGRNNISFENREKLDPGIVLKNTTNDHDKFGITKLSENKIDENVNTTRLNHVEKVHQHVSGNSMDAEHDSGSNRTISNTTISNKDGPATITRKNKQGNKGKRKFGVKNNGLDTILIFKNLNEINDLYDRTFSDPEFTSSNLGSVELMKLNRSTVSDRALVPENRMATVITGDKNYFRNQMTESETPRSSGTFILRDAEERILEEHNISNSSNGSIQNQIRVTEKGEEILKIDISTEDMYSSATENYQTMQKKNVESTNITTPKGNLKTNPYVNVKRSKQSKSHTEPFFVGVVNNTKESVLSRNFRKETEDTFVKPIEVTLERVNIPYKGKSNLDTRPQLLNDFVETPSNNHSIKTPIIKNNEYKTPIQIHNSKIKHTSYLSTSSKPSFSTTTECCSETTPREDFSTDTRNYASFVETSHPESSTKSFQHSELSKKSKLIDHFEVVHETHDLHNDEPKYKTIHTNGQTNKGNYFNNQRNNILESENNRFKSDNDLRNVKPNIHSAALIMPRNRYPEEVPYQYFPHSSNSSHNIKTYIPTAEENESGDPGNIDTPQNIITYRPTILDDSNFRSNLTKNMYGERSSGEDTTDSTYYNDYPAETPSYTDHPENTTNNINGNMDDQYSDYENTDPPRDEYSELSTPIGPGIFENPLKPPTMTTVDPSSSIGSYGFYDNANKNQENIGNVPHFDYTSNEEINTSTETTEKDSNNNLQFSGGITYTSQLTKDIIDQVRNVYTKPPIHHYGIPNIGINTATSKPYVPENLVYHKIVKPTTYATSQNFKAKINQFLKNKLPPDKPTMDLFHNNLHGSTFPRSNEESEQLTTPNPESVKNNVLFGHSNGSSEEIINQFLNSPLDFNDFEQSFGSTPKVPDDIKDIFDSGHNHEVKGNAMLDNFDSFRNKSHSGVSNFRNPVTKTKQTNFSQVTNTPKFLQSFRLRDVNSFQPILLGAAPENLSPFKDYFGKLGNVQTPFHEDYFHPIKFEHNIENIMHIAEQINPEHILDGRYQTMSKDPYPLLKTHAVRPNRIILRGNHKPSENHSPFSSHSSESFKGIDIFLPRKNKFLSIGKNVDVLTPARGGGHLIKLTPIHKIPTLVHQLGPDDKSLEIEIITEPKVESHTSRREYIEETTLDAAITEAHDKSNTDINATPTNEIRYYGGFQPSFEETSRPSDLSMGADHMVPAVDPIVKKILNTSSSDSEILSNSTEENPGQSKKFSQDFAGNTEISFDRFNTEQEINSYLKHIARIYGHKVNVSTIGETIEGRPIQAVKISHGGVGNPIIVLDGGIHAREWIAPATVLYVLQQLVENPENFPMFRKVDWILIPMLNPDGYVYSMTKDRMWRKNRARPRKSEVNQCYGVDLNRNFGVFRGRRHINLESSGASDDPCASNYRGVSPFSEPESRALRDLILDNKAHIKLYVSFHSYGNYFMYPWSYKRTLPNDWKDLDGLATAVRGAIFNITGTRYKIGSTADIMGVNSGGSDDWVKGYVGVKYCYTVELPRGGAQGFDLPNDQIRKVVHDMFEGVKVFARFIEREFVV
ncbi:hypothetical protein M8J75_004534 [Diaphorina citri]|nr:hypothetical protein M8J75_004534 [Diaphorina citri]KAI5735221.1 hypothetical protein M8J77_015736 [Diaphorina citri]